MTATIESAIRNAPDASAVLRCLHEAAEAGALDDAALLALRGALLDQAQRCTGRPPAAREDRLRRRCDRVWGRVSGLDVRDGRWYVTVALPQGPVTFGAEALVGESPEWEPYARSSICFPNQIRATPLSGDEVRAFIVQAASRDRVLDAIRSATAAVLGWDRQDAHDLHRRLEAMRRVYGEARWHGHGYCLLGTEIRDWLEVGSDDPTLVAIDAAGRQVHHDDLGDDTDWTGAPFKVIPRSRTALAAEG